MKTWKKCPGLFLGDIKHEGHHPIWKFPHALIVFMYAYYTINLDIYSLNKWILSFMVELCSNANDYEM